jgi:hypothetical protein
MTTPARPPAVARAESRAVAVLVKSGASDNTYTRIVAEDIVGEYMVTGNVTAYGLIRQLIGDTLAGELAEARAAEKVSA